MEEFKISIVIPVYNASKYIAACIDSILKQTVDNYEIVLVNDGSTDNSLEIMQKYVDNYPDKIKVFSIENHGVSYARNYGVERACGEYILFADSDDFIEPKMCEKLISKAEENNNDVVLCNYYSTRYNNAKKKFDKKPSNAYIVEIGDNFDISKDKHALAHISPFPWDKLYRRSLFEKYRFPEGIRFEDLAVIYRIMCEAGSIGVVHECLYNYRKTSTTSFMNTFTTGTLDIEKALRNMLEGFKADGRFEEYKEELEYICTRHIFVRFHSFFTDANRGKLELKLELLEVCYKLLEEYFDNWRDNHYLKYSTSAYMRSRIALYTDKEALIKAVKKFEKTPFIFLRIQRKRKDLSNRSKAKVKAIKEKYGNALKEFLKSKDKVAYIAKRIHVLKIFRMPPAVKYTKYYDTCPVDDRIVLFMSKQGEDVAGNVFRMILSMKAEKYRQFDIKLVLNPGLMDKFAALFERYGIDYVDFVSIKDNAYYKLLATAKYLVNDTSFPPYYIKRPEQVYLNTWHGTPLKAMGRVVPKREYALGNVQRNFYIADYLLYQNEFSRDRFFEDYMITQLYNGKILLSGYPRNSAFFNTHRYQEIREELELNGMQIIVYMPTWRGLLTKKENNKQIEELENYFYELDESLKDDQIMYVKLHPFVNKAMNLTAFAHIKPMPAEYELYDFLNAADMLITDYSSIMFDFAVSKKRIILFTYDRKEYLKDRGMYLGLNDLEFPKADTVPELVEEINKPITGMEYPAFFEEYCKYDSASASDEVCSLLCFGDKVSFDVSPAEKNGKKNVLVFTAFRNPKSIRKLINTINRVADDENYNFYLCMIAEDARKHTSMLDKLDKRINFIPLTFKVNYRLWEKVAASISLKTGIKAKSAFASLARRELKKHFGTIKFDYVINYSLNEWVSAHMCNEVDAVTICNVRMIKALKLKRSRKYRKQQKIYIKNANNYDWVIFGKDTKNAVKVSGATKTIYMTNISLDFKRLMKEVTE